MKGIIDIHAHILPDIDDGAYNMEEAQEMLMMAFRQGIHNIIATPHYKRGQSPEYIIKLYRKLQQSAFEIHKQYQIFLGQEILYSEDILEDLKEKRAFTMCGSTYVLIEFDPFIPYSRMFQSLRKIILARYIPILAHMERYPCLRKKGRVKELIDSGCMLQMNYSSITGYPFNKNVRWCRHQIKKEYVHMMGTDMHHINKRKPEIKKALIWINKHCRLETYQKLVCGNSEAMLKEKNE